MFKAVQSSLKSRIITVTSLCLIVLLMGIFFAAQTYSVAVEAVSLNKGNVKESIWNVELVPSSYKETEGSIPSVSNKVLSDVIINEVTLNNPNEFLEYSVTINNTGNLETVLKNINIDGLNENVTATILVNNETFNNEMELEENGEYIVTIRVTYNEVEVVEPQELKLVTTFEFEQK